MALVTCAYCGCKTVDKNSKDYIKYKDKNYHIKCYENQKERDDFYSLVCLTFGLKAPGPRIYNQANNFVNTYNYTYKGMENTLRYIYEVKKKKDKFDIANKTIGLIPYYYEEASKYYANVEFKKEKITEQINKIKENEKIVVVKINTAKANKKLTYNLDEIE